MDVEINPFFSFLLGDHNPAHFSLVRAAVGKNFSNSTYPLLKNLLFSLHVYRAMIPFGPCAGIEVRASVLGIFPASLMGKKNPIHLKFHISVHAVNIVE